MSEKQDNNGKKQVAIKEVKIINEEIIQNKIYIIRGQKVMLDFELAEIYGYTTTAFNQQVKNNIDKFDEDFMFQLNKTEYESLISKNLISKRSTSNRGGRTKLPKVFTEQGIYMLMTVLRGNLATIQSKALIRTFKKMKDYIIENQSLIGQREYLQLSMQISQNFSETIDLRKDLNDIEEQVAEVVDKLSDIVYKSELSEIMTEFGEPQIKRGYLVLNGQPFKADIAYAEIYSQAKKRIYIIDNYISIKTLEHLINCPVGVEITIFSDNLHNGLRLNVFNDFCKEYPDLNISIKKSGGVFHDRYIVIDYGTDDIRIFHCGASSKDAGARITSISELETVDIYKATISGLLHNCDLYLK